MLVYIRIEDGLKRRAEELVSRGLYPDFNTVATVALENLLVAEEESAQGTSLNVTSAHAQAVSAASASPVKIELPKAVQWDGSVSVAKKLIIPFPADLFRPDQKVPVEKWIFGQQNRVLPAKINARLFLGLIDERGSEAELFDAANAISS